VFEDVADDAFLSCEEVFGPVTTLYRYGTPGGGDRARQRCPLRALGGVFTTDMGTAARCVDELQAGIIHVNSQTAGAEVHVPFGGIKSSGYGPHEQGRAAIHFYTEEITVYQDA